MLSMWDWFRWKMERVFFPLCKYIHFMVVFNVRTLRCSGFQSILFFFYLLIDISQIIFSSNSLHWRNMLTNKKFHIFLTLVIKNSYFVYFSTTCVLNWIFAKKLLCFLRFCIISMKEVYSRKLLLLSQFGVT